MDLNRNSLWWCVLTFALLLGLAFFISVCWFVCAFSWSDSTDRRPLDGASEWPPPIREMHEALVSAKIEVEPFEVYLLDGEPGQTLCAVVCRLPESEQSLDLLKLRFHLSELSHADQQFIVKFNQKMAEHAPADWWVDAESKSIRYFTSYDINEYNEGDFYTVAIDPDTHLMFIHYYFIF